MLPQTITVVVNVKTRLIRVILLLPEKWGWPFKSIKSKEDVEKNSPLPAQHYGHTGYSRGSGDFHDGWDFKVPHGVDKMLLLSTTVQFTKLVMKSVGGTFGLSPVTVTMKSIKKDLIPEAILVLVKGYRQSW